MRRAPLIAAWTLVFGGDALAQSCSPPYTSDEAVERARGMLCLETWQTETLPETYRRLSNGSGVGPARRLMAALNVLDGAAGDRDEAITRTGTVLANDEALRDFMRLVMLKLVFSENLEDYCRNRVSPEPKPSFADQEIEDALKCGMK